MRLLVGRIGRAHGILGEATIEVRTDEPDRRFAIGAIVQTDTHGELTITSGRVHNGVLLLGFNGISDRNGIENFAIHCYMPMLISMKKMNTRMSTTSCS
jgi:16S rRNA processing protein RimM